MAEVSKVLKELNSIEKELSLLRGIYALLNWDKDVNLPKKAFEQRADQETLISVQIHELLTSKKLVSIIKILSQKSIYSKLSKLDKVRVDLYNWKLKKQLKVPKSHVEEYTKVLSLAHNAWVNARNKESYAEFMPQLKKVFDLKKKEAKYIDARAHPYNIFLDDYERGITINDIDPIFLKLKHDLLEILSKIKKSSNYAKINSVKPESFGSYSKEMQLEVSKELSKKILLDTNRYMIAETIHPFMTTISSDDIRITTAVRSDPFFSFGSTVHESGHALYEINFDPKIRDTILVSDGSLSLALHESQSRFWENIVCKSKSFWKGYYSYYASKFPFLKKVSLEKFYQSINIAMPTLVRIESDELTYGLHVIIRYEIEKGIFDGTIKIEDLEAVWNAKYKEYLGVVPNKPSKGVIQDSHWSGGNIGYFPTYVLGSIYSVMIYNAMKRENPKIDLDIQNLDFNFIRNWLKEHIHKYGASKTSKEIILAACGKDLDVSEFTSYLKNKYYKMYGIKE
jgi:carboxypeptidase Taq